MTGKISASAPNSFFVCGEFAFDWGAKALVVPAEIGGQRASATLAAQEGRGKIVIYDGSRMVSLEPSGRVVGEPGMRPFLEAAKKAAATAKCDFTGLPDSLSISISFPGALFRQASTASASAALCACLFEYFGASVRQAQLLECVLESESLFRPGASSAFAIPAITGEAAVFKKTFLLDGSQKCSSRAFGAQVPGSSRFLYASTGAENQKTHLDFSPAFLKTKGDLSASRAGRTPSDLAPAQRAKVAEGFDAVTEKILRELSGGGSATKLGSILGLAHALLSDAGFCTASAQNAVGFAAKIPGIRGAKMAGYDGGIVLCCDDAMAADAAKALAKGGFEVHGLRFPAQALRLDAK